jgi:site-specific DNA-methyltransferase (adenine-specific)
MISDPPYGTGAEKGYGRTELHGRGGRRIAGDESLQVFNESLALVKTENLCVFTSPKRASQVLAIIAAHGFEHRHELIWDKLLAGLSNTIRYQHESIYIATKGEFIGRSQTSILRGLSPARGGAHPHEKPENVVGALVELVRPSSVIDPFTGTGTTLVVCRLRGIKCVGIELEEKYCEIAAKRCEQGLLWQANERFMF